MDFLALPRRDLQALCKRNGVRANMTNAAMADALRALPMIDGIEEYVKQPVAVAAPAGKVVADEQQKKLEKQGSPLPRGRRATAKSSEPMKSDEAKEEERGDAKRQSNKEDALALGVGRRGASRGARHEPVVPQPAGTAEEEERNPLAEWVEDPKREANKETAPAAVVGRRGANRRARPSLEVAAPAAESGGAGVAEKQSEKQGSDVPRGRRVKAKSTEPTRVDDNDEDGREGVKPEDKQEDAPVLGVGRRGGSRRARAAPAVAVAAPAGNAEEALRAPILRGCHAKAKSTEIIMLDDSDEEKENTKPEEEEDAPAIVVGRRGASRRAPAQAPATKRTAATSNTEAGDVATEAVPIRLTRQRKPTMKAAAAAAEEKAPRRATRKGAVRKTQLHQEEQEEPQVVVSCAEVVPALVSDQGCDPEYSEEASDPQNEELIEVVEAPLKQEDEVVDMIEDEKLMEDNPAEEALVTEQECTNKSTLLVQQANVEKCPAPLTSQEDSPILAAGDDEGAKFQAREGSSEGALGNRECEDAEEVHDADQKVEIVPAVQVMQATLTDEEPTEEIADEVNHKREKEINEVETEDDLVSQEKEDMYIDDLQADLVGGEAIVLDCSVNISQVAGEKTKEVNTEYEDMVVAKVLPDMVDETNILEVEEKTGDITSEMPDNRAALDEDGKETILYASIRDGHKLNEVVIGDSMSQTTVTDCEAVKEEKAPLISDKMPQGAAAIDEDQFEAAFVHADQVKMTEADNLPEVKISDCEIVEEENTALIVDEKQQSTATIDDDVVDGHCITDVVRANQQMEVVTTDELQELTGTIDRDVLDDHLKNDVVHSDEQKEVISTDGEVVEEEKATGITEDMPNITDTMDECVMENYFGLHSEQKKAITDDIVPEVSTTEDGSRKENTFTCDLPQDLYVAEDSNGHIIPALVDVTESLSKSVIIVEPPVPVAGDTLVCKNSSEKNTTEPVAVYEENGEKVAKKSVDLSKLSLGQLRAKLKKKLNAKKEKEAKRVALARVDENVCRSHAKGQQQNLNLQHH